jgi:hypothetical protein
MINNPTGGQSPEDQSQPNKSDKEGANIRQDNSSETAADSAGAGASDPTAQAEKAESIFDDFKKQAAQSAEQLGWLGEFMRAAREYRGANININILHDSVAINAPTEVGGDLVGGDKLKRAAASFVSRAESGVSGQVYASEIEKTVSVYVEPAAHQRACQILSEKHLLILWGAAGMGKRSAAIRLLESFHQETIFEIAPTLEGLKDFHCQTKQGYLWRTPPAEKINSLPRSVVDQISREHKGEGSHLVITLAKDARIDTDAMRDYLLEWDDCPDGAAVLGRHLAWRLKKESEQVRAEAEALRHREQIIALINGALRRPSQAARLAESLVRLARGELSLEKLMTAFADLDHQDVKTWFEEHPQRNQRLQMIALAVLEGSTLQRIGAAGEDLQAAVASNGPTNVNGATTEIAEAELPLDTEQWLIEFQAKIVYQEISAQYGRSTVEAVIFKNPQFQTAVLAYAWQRLQRWRTPLLNWLVELGGGGGMEYRIAAAAALSELSQYHAFDDVLREAVSVWAKAGEPGQRRLAAFILMLQALRKNLSAQALGVLHHWATLRGNWRLQWTAATAYGTELGLAYPELAARDLYEVFLSRNPALHVSVLTTLRYLFECGRQQPQLFTLVLRTLESWARDERLVKQNALYIFWELLRSQVRVEGNSWPTILRLAVLDETGAYKRQFCTLFSMALTYKEIRGLLLEDLQAWLALADANQELYELLGWVIYSLFKSPDARLKLACRVIADRLKKWAARGQSQSAGKLLAALNKYCPM